MSDTKGFLVIRESSRCVHIVLWHFLFVVSVGTTSKPPSTCKLTSGTKSYLPWWPTTALSCKYWYSFNSIKVSLVRLEQRLAPNLLTLCVLCLIYQAICNFSNGQAKVLQAVDSIYLARESRSFFGGISDLRLSWSGYSCFCVPHDLGAFCLIDWWASDGKSSVTWCRWWSCQ